MERLVAEIAQIIERTTDAKGVDADYAARLIADAIVKGVGEIEAQRVTRAAFLNKHMYAGPSQ